MEELYPWLGDLHRIEGLGREWVGLISVLASLVCGAFIGIERERRDKPAGLRTMMLIAVGSTVFTLVSLLLAESKETADPARLAAQILPGIGFLGAGAIIQSRGTVVGLTTGATIWAVAAVGVTIGAGYVAAGFVFTMIIFLTLTVLHELEWVVTGRCRTKTAVVSYLPERGKTWPRIQEALDRHRIADSTVARFEGAGGEHGVRFPVCTVHREHRVLLKELAEIPEVISIEER